MGFDSGTFTFRRFAVLGHNMPETIESAHLEKLAESALREKEIGSVEEEEYGWVGGRHLFDTEFDFAHNVFNDCIHFALRVDSNKVPGDLKSAYLAMEEDAIAKTNPSGFISKQQKKEVKETVRARLEDEQRSGRFRRSRLIPLLWDFTTHTLYCPATGKNLEKLHEIFERTFGLSLLPISSGSLALRLLEPRGRRRDYEDARPTRFVHGPEGEGVLPEYPWVLKGPEPKDFLGNEFLLWLWQQTDVKEGRIDTDAAGRIELLIDKSLDLDCAYGITGRDGLRGDGPTDMPEARDALRVGKLPRKCALSLVLNKQQFDLKLNAEDFTFGGTRLPEVEDADSPRVLFEERITLLRDLVKGWDALFDTFLKLRCSSAWEGHVSQIRKWILASSKQPMTAVA
jgi:hypothetical protein